MQSIGLKHFNDPPITFNEDPAINEEISHRYIYVAPKSSGVEPGGIYRKISKAFKKTRRLHFIKLNYRTPVFGDYVMRNFENIRGPRVLRNIPVISYFARCIILIASIEKREEINRRAVIEALGNDLYRALGVRTQKLQLIRAEYHNGKEKFLLDGAEARGENFEAFHTFRGQIHKGALPNGKVKVGEHSYSVNQKELARVGVAALLLSDWDKVGSEGDNLGFYISEEDQQAHIMNIDTGQSLSSGMSLRDITPNLLRDKKFSSQLDLLSNQFANFSIFSATEEEDRLEAFSDIVNHYSRINTVFKEYSEAMSEHPKIQKNIQSLEEAFHQRLTNTLATVAQNR